MRRFSLPGTEIRARGVGLRGGFSECFWTINGPGSVVLYATFTADSATLAGSRPLAGHYRHARSPPTRNLSRFSRRGRSDPRPSRDLPESLTFSRFHRLSCLLTANLRRLPFPFGQRTKRANRKATKGTAEDSEGSRSEGSGFLPADFSARLGKRRRNVDRKSNSPLLDLPFSCSSAAERLEEPDWPLSGRILSIHVLTEQRKQIRRVHSLQMDQLGGERNKVNLAGREISPDLCRYAC